MNELINVSLKRQKNLFWKNNQDLIMIKKFFKKLKVRISQRSKIFINFYS